MHSLQTWLKTCVRWVLQPLNFMLTLCALIPVILLGAYIVTDANHYPAIDSFLVNSTPALNAVKGHLTIGDLVAPYGAHITFFTKLTSAILAVSTRWNFRYESIVIFTLGLVNLILVLFLLRKIDLKLFRWALVPCSLLMLSIRFGFSWLDPAYTSWHFGMLFVLLIFNVLAYMPRKWLAINLAGIFAICAAFSIAATVAALPTLPIVGWLLGYRKKRYLSALACWAILGLAFYFLLISQQPAQLITHGKISIPLFVDVFLITLGSLIGGFSIQISQIVCIVAAIVVAANVYYLVKQKYSWDKLGLLIGLTLVAGVATALITIGIFGRADTTLELAQNEALFQRYAHPSTLFWIPVVAVIILALENLNRLPDHSRFTFSLIRINIVFLVAVAALHVNTVYQNLDSYIAAGYPLSSLRANEACLRDYPLIHDSACIEGIIDRYGSLPDQIAAYGLTDYAQRTPELVLPASYRTKDKIVVATESAWRNSHIRDLLLNGVERDNVLYFLPLAARNELDEQQKDAPQPLNNVILGQPENTTWNKFINEAETVWVVESTPKSSELAPSENDFKAGFQKYAVLETPYKLTVQQYFRPPTDPGVVSRFGDNLNLRDWAIRDDLSTLNPCQQILLRSWWSIDKNPPEDYQMALVLVDVNDTTQGVSQTNAPIGTIHTRDWQPKQLYADERLLTIPCDIRAGKYMILVGAYGIDPQTGSALPALPATLQDGTPLGQVSYLTTLEIKHAKGESQGK